MGIPLQTGEGSVQVHLNVSHVAKYGGRYREQLQQHKRDIDHIGSMVIVSNEKKKHRRMHVTWN